jgi:hypothetical protein
VGGVELLGKMTRVVAEESFAERKIVVKRRRERVKMEK